MERIEHLGVACKRNRQRLNNRCEPIRAELAGSHHCKAEGFAVRSSAPILALCRKLIAAGVDPGRPLHAYRGDVLCLRVRSIGECAKLTVAEGARDLPRFRQWKAPHFREGSPPARQNEMAEVSL